MATRLASWQAPLPLAASHGGAGAIAVFVVFVVAFAVLIGFVIRFARQQARQGGGRKGFRERRFPPGGGDPQT
jgi:hypothetical protein